MDYQAARHNMVESQIRTNKVTDTALLEALYKIPREFFTPEGVRSVCYLDEDIEVAPGRYMLEPMVLARMIQALSLSKTDKVLDVGCGTGYSAAVLAHLAGQVVAVENTAELLEIAFQALDTAVYSNVSVLESASLEEGGAEQAPYQAILAAGTYTQVPSSLLDLLDEGGRLASIERPSASEPGVAVLYRKINGVAVRQVLFDAYTPYFPNHHPQEAFAF